MVTPPGDFDRKAPRSIRQDRSNALSPETEDGHEDAGERLAGGLVVDRSVDALRVGRLGREPRRDEREYHDGVQVSTRTHIPPHCNREQQEPA